MSCVSCPVVRSCMVGSINIFSISKKPTHSKRRRIVTKRRRCPSTQRNNVHHIDDSSLSLHTSLKSLTIGGRATITRIHHRLNSAAIGSLTLLTSLCLEHTDDIHDDAFVNLTNIIAHYFPANVGLPSSSMHKHCIRTHRDGIRRRRNENRR